jgi:hypothetical protein
MPEAAPKVIVWDEYNRPKDTAAFAKLMEITQEWSIAGCLIPGGHPGERVADRQVRSRRRDRTRVVEADIDDDGRAWMTKCTLDRMIKPHGRGLLLHLGTVYLGDGQYAPVPLTALVDRLANRPVTGLRELAADVRGWEERLRRAAED